MKTLQLLLTAAILSTSTATIAGWGPFDNNKHYHDDHRNSGWNNGRYNNWNNGHNNRWDNRWDDNMFGDMMNDMMGDMSGDMDVEVKFKIKGKGKGNGRGNYSGYSRSGNDWNYYSGTFDSYGNNYRNEYRSYGKPYYYRPQAPAYRYRPYYQNAAPQRMPAPAPSAPQAGR